MNWETLVDDSNGNYELIVANLEQAIITNPSQSSNYQYLGLAYSILDRNEKAKNIWNLGYENTPYSTLFWQELYEILEKEANFQEDKQEYFISLNIRQGIRQLLPEDFNNLVQTFYLMEQLKSINSSTIKDLNLYEIIALKFTESQDKSLLLQLIVNILSSQLQEDQKLEFVTIAQKYFSDKEGLFNILVSHTHALTTDSAIKLLQLILEYYPKHISAFTTYNYLLSETAQFDKAIQTAQKFLSENQEDIEARTICSYLLVSSHLLNGSKWEDTLKEYEILASLIAELTSKEFKVRNLMFLNVFLLTSFHAAYIDDRPISSRLIQNQVSRFFQEKIRSIEPTIAESYQEQHSARHSSPIEQKIKIGFLSTTLREHSVGWLARFLIDNLDRNSFDLYGYFPEAKANSSFLQTWYISKMQKVIQPVKGLANFLDIAKRIADDKIDILLDLESITSGLCSQIVALKPAPIQVTWLGWDASGIPAIDYYIADPYVLPENAQDYYSEKIWRLPNAYIAIDGFETTVPNISRESLEIPDDAIIYFSSQSNRKRHPETVRLQMQILKQVSNSYFLIKGFKKSDRAELFFREISEAEGVKWEQLRFLPLANSEAEHRANLSIADVVLDTYPYSGATTTMEVLWMGIPLVTRVGEQYVARNSYTMMMNAGITEGIAWNPEEYVEWGVRFGTEPDLRRDVAWKLRQSRKTSPLWNSKQFTKDMEKALKQMWEIYNG